MRRLYFALALFAALFQVAGTQAAPLNPGDDLLREAKAVVESGRADDPAAVARLLHLRLIRQNLNLSPPSACPAGAFQFDDDYTASPSSWFHNLPTGIKNMRLANIVGDIGMPGFKTVGDPRFTDTIQSGLYPQDGCVGPGLGLVRTTMDFENIPGYACISLNQVLTDFPKTVLISYGVPTNISYFRYKVTGQYLRSVVLPYVDKNNPYATAVTGPADLNANLPYAFIDFTMTEAPLDNQPPCLLNLTIKAAYNYGPLHKPILGKLAPAYAAQANCSSDLHPLDHAFCEAAANFSARANLTTLFKRSLSNLTPQQQSAAGQAQAAWLQGLNRTCTVTTRNAVYVDFGCATNAINRRVTAMLAATKSPPPPLVPSGFLAYQAGNDDCDTVTDALTRGICQFGYAYGAAADYREVHDDYLIHLADAKKDAFLASQKTWHRHLQQNCTATFDQRLFVDFSCVGSTIYARADFLAAELSDRVNNYSGQYTIPGNAMPWFNLGGWNDQYGFGTPNGIGPTVLTLAGLHAHPGQKLTIKYLSGTLTDPTNRPLTGPGGQWNATVSAENGFVIRKVGPFMPALTGAFTDSSGNIIQAWEINGNVVFPIASDGATETIPAGATQLQLGIDRGRFDQNAGSITVSVIVSK